MAKHLFIGGPADGKWYDTQGRSRWEVADRWDLPRVEDWEKLSLYESRGVRIVQYRAEYFRCGPGEERIVYIIHGMSILEAFDRLLKGYKNGESTVPGLREGR